MPRKGTQAKPLAMLTSGNGTGDENGVCIPAGGGAAPPVTRNRAETGAAQQKKRAAVPGTAVGAGSKKAKPNVLGS